jgi:anti-sigma-K factor RskA
MTERQEELAALHALRMLEPEEARVFLGEIKYAPKSIEYVNELEEVAAELAELIEPEDAPAQCRAAVFDAIAGRRRDKTVTKMKSGTKVLLGVLGWAAAATIAVSAYGMWFQMRSAQKQLADVVQTHDNAQQEAESLRAETGRLKQQLASAEQKTVALNEQIVRLQATNPLSSLEAAALRAQNNSWADTGAVIVWDPAKQEGLLRMTKARPVSANKDYQLWVIDKELPAPVSAGIVKIDEQGVATITFKPTAAVSHASAFAVSIEVKGGVPKREGPIVMMGP